MRLWRNTKPLDDHEEFEETLDRHELELRKMALAIERVEKEVGIYKAPIIDLSQRTRHAS